MIIMAIYLTKGQRIKIRLSKAREAWKCLFLAVISFLMVQNAYSQKVTESPRVDNDSFDETSVMRVTSVITGLGEEKLTLITFQYATTLFKSWIALSSRTTLTTDKSQKKQEILDWGIITDDEENMFSSLNFNEQYSLKRRIAYNLYMVFPAISENATLLGIQEPGHDGFFWHGIHINDKSTENLPKGRQYQPHHSNGEFRPTGSGSGFAISKDGHIATCNHVIEDARKIQIRGVNGNFGKVFDAKIVVTDKENDLAILKIDNTQLAQIPYSLAPTLQDVGEDIFVLGYPQTQHLGEELKLTNGIISSRSGYRGDMTTYQISAQVLPGNSGCPLFNHNGNVIGVVSAKYIEPNVSYAVKLSYLKTLIEKSGIRQAQEVSNSLTNKSLSEKVKSIRNFVYIIEVEE
jgi:S1-C subfamily serine protease